MTREEACKILAEMYRNAPSGETAVSIHLFAIKYADQIEGIPAKEIAIGAGLPESYHAEISKGRKLAKYVRLR